MKPFLDALHEAPLLWDGAMGSLLYERGVFLTRCFDELNVSQPEIVLQVHRDYVAAGADVVETNTYGAHHLALARHGFSDKAKEIVWSGVQLARQACEGRQVYVAGAIGPSGVEFAAAMPEDRALAIDALTQLARELLAAGVDLIVLETFPQLAELVEVTRAIRALDPKIPIVAQATFGEDGKVSHVAPLEAANRMAKAGANVVGANCGLGPNELYDIAMAMIPSGVPVTIQPNAGLPRQIDGRSIYVANPENFGVYARRLLQAGVRMIGGCCGTTPEHTRRMLGAVRMIGARPLPTRSVSGGSAKTNTEAPKGVPPVPLAERSTLAAKLAAGKFVVSCELSAPAGTNPSKTLEAARKLREGAGVIDLVCVEGV